MFKPASRMFISRARQLRRTTTDAERLLWSRLRRLNREGFQFHRQAPFQSYILDFAEHQARVAIEIDGGQHADALGRRTDSARDKVLAEEGYRVLRFWNNEVKENLDSVVDAILKEVRKRLHPPPPARALRRSRPPHKGGGDK